MGFYCFLLGNIPPNMARIASTNPAIGIHVGCIAMVCVAAFTVFVELPLLGLLLLFGCILIVMLPLFPVFMLYVVDVMFGFIV